MIKQSGAIPLCVKRVFTVLALFRRAKCRGELILFLLRAGADRNHRNKRGKAPVDLAKNIANHDVTQFFVQRYSSRHAVREYAQFTEFYQH